MISCPRCKSGQMFRSTEMDARGRQFDETTCLQCGHQLSYDVRHVEERPVIPCLSTQCHRTFSNRAQLKAHMDYAHTRKMAHTEASKEQKARIGITIGPKIMKVM